MNVLDGHEDDWTIEKILACRDRIHVAYAEPWPGVAADGQHIDIHMVMRLSVDDAIAWRRHAMTEFHHRLDMAIKMSEEELLADFMTVNWAWVEHGRLQGPPQEPIVEGDSK